MKKSKKEVKKTVRKEKAVKFIAIADGGCFPFGGQIATFSTLAELKKWSEDETNVEAYEIARKVKVTKTITIE